MEAKPVDEQTKKLDVVKDINQLKLKAQNLEREKATHIYSKHNDFHSEFTGLRDLDDRLVADRSSEQVRLQQQLIRMQGMVKKFQRQLKDVKPTPEFVEKLKVMMEEIESHISDFKDRQRQQYEEMLREERITSQEVAALDQRFASWSQQGAALDELSNQKRGGSLPSHRETPRDLPPEVKAFERFVTATGGPRGGWDEYDHSTFLRFRNRHKGKLSFLQDAVNSLPTKTDVEIRQHEEWYQQYLTLNDTKKEAIQKWKDRKEIEKDEILSKAGKDEQTEAEIQRQKDEAHQKMLGDEKLYKKAELNRWKVEKELEKAEEERRKLQEQLDKAKQEEQHRRIQESRKRELGEYKQHQKEVKTQLKAEEEWRHRVEEDAKRKQASELIVKYRERDLSAVKQKRAKEEAKQEADRQRQKRIHEQLRDQMAGRVERDPSRLLQPTEGWRERQKQPASTGGGPVIHMPHRAVPSWRQGLH